MEIHKVPINTLTSPDWNPRSITDEELLKLETSIKEFGYIEPIIVNDVNMHVVGGNQRLKALEALGYSEVDAVYVHIEDLAKEKACNIALNKISGDWDNDKLQIVLEEIELSPIDIELTGFDVQLENIPQDITNEIYPSNENNNSNTQTSDDTANIIENNTDEYFEIPEDEPEYDETIADTIESITCPRCGYELPKH